MQINLTPIPIKNPPQSGFNITLFLPLGGINRPPYSLTSLSECCDSMSAQEGGCSERTQPFQTPLRSNSLRAVLCSGWCWDVFWKKGRAGATQQHHRRRVWQEWQVKELFQASGRHRNVHKSSSGLRSGFSPRHFGPFWTYICLSVNLQQRRIQSRRLFCFICFVFFFCCIFIHLTVTLSVELLGVFFFCDA